MSVVWKLNGETFTSLGLSRLTRHLRTLAPDIVTFISDGTAFDADDLDGLAIGDDVVITVEVDAVATQWFKGKVTGIPRIGAPEGEALKYTVTGPWWYLDNLVYRQNFPLDPTANPTVADPSAHRRAVAIIGQGPDGNPVINVAAQTDILDWCIASGADFERGDLPEGYRVPYTGLTAPTCAEALRTSLRWMPDAASRFDYTEEVPVFSIIRRGDADAVTLDLTSEPSIKSISINPRPDLKIDHVVIQEVAVNFDNAFVVEEQVDPPGSTGREFGSIVIPLTADLTSPIFPGLAENWRSGLSTLQYQGTLVFVEEECLRTVRPGDVVNLTGGLAAWATMRAQVVEVHEDIDAGETEWTFGPPEHLSVQDLVEMIQSARGQTASDLGAPITAGRRDPTASGIEKKGFVDASSGSFTGGIDADNATFVTLHVTDTATIVAISGNTASFTGGLDADNGTFAGALSAASATFATASVTGGFDADNATIAGALSAASATFGTASITGGFDADNATIANSLTADSATFATASVTGGFDADNATIADALSAASATFGTASVTGGFDADNATIAGALSAGSLTVTGTFTITALAAATGSFTGGIDADNATIAGALSADSATFATASVTGGFDADNGTFENLTVNDTFTINALEAATGSFTGGLDADNATFAGALSAASATFGTASITGGLDADNATIAGALSADSATFATASVTGGFDADNATIAGTLSAGSLTVSGTFTIDALTADTATIGGHDVVAELEDFEDRIAAIETLLSGKSGVTLHICDAGVEKTTTVIGTTPA